MDYSGIAITFLDTGAGYPFKDDYFSDKSELSPEKAANPAELENNSPGKGIFQFILIKTGRSNLVQSIEITENIINKDRNRTVIILIDSSLSDNFGEPLSPGVIWLPADCGKEILFRNILSRRAELEKRQKDMKDLLDDRELFELFLEFNPSYVFIKDHNVKTLKLSRNYEEMLGHPMDELLGKSMFELFPSDLAKSIDSDDRGILERGEPFEVEEEMNGRHYTTRKFPIFRKNKPPLLAGFTIDITRRYKAEKELEKLATEDPLTGISNRRQLFISGQLLLDSAIRAKVPISVLMIDIDDFKLYNDTYGHQAGDECLIRVARMIRDVFQRYNDITARFGGEEFTVILFNTDSGIAREAGRELCQRMEDMKIPHETATTGGVVTLSAGVTTSIPGEKDTLYDLISLADRALYEAKDNGKNRSIYFE